MRLLLICVAVTLGAPTAWAEDAETFVIQVPDPKGLFRVEDLSPYQAELCAEFRRLAGAYRKPAFDALRQAGAFPIDEKRVGEAHVVALLGEPDRAESGWLVYFLGFGDGGGHSMHIMLVDGRAAMIWFSRTL